ncbi:hypothetical protein MTR_3g461450 [Medicago truncatula]|uniref:Uncharacterized protein n=1 Tax=Medicago truncatula TaxID=3880 RepID=A0A072UXE9_MEDTR|nr:hypothetical protein MTR_3g461450 [Medicago truncatula]
MLHHDWYLKQYLSNFQQEQQKPRVICAVSANWALIWQYSQSYLQPKRNKHGSLAIDNAVIPYNSKVNCASSDVCLGARPTSSTSHMRLRVLKGMLGCHKGRFTAFWLIFFVDPLSSHHHLRLITSYHGVWSFPFFFVTKESVFNEAMNHTSNLLAKPIESLYVLPLL